MEWEQLLRSQNPDTLLDLRAIFDLQDEDQSGILEAEEVCCLAMFMRT
jgi:hypothetical protein